MTDILKSVIVIKTDLANIQNPVTGDIYKVVDSVTNDYTRYIYTGTAWEELLELSNYYTKEEIDQIIEDLRNGGTN